MIVICQARKICKDKDCIHRIPHLVDNMCDEYSCEDYDIAIKELYPGDIFCKPYIIE
jgi:hypothetical protein